jgi:ATP-dependent helicase/nuclease subunit A
MIDHASLFAFRHNVVLVASAGTGKTHALVGVLLHALLGVSELQRGPLDPERACATTFSRKAAAEIRARVTSELERLALRAPSAYDADLDAAAARLEIPWGPAVRAERARAALARATHANIGTLHGLAFGIARSHALAVGLPPAFEVASELESESWATDAVTASLDDHARRDAPGVRDFLRLLRGTERAIAELVRLLLAIEEDGRAASSLTLPEGDADAYAAQMQTLVDQARRLEGDPRCAEMMRALLEAHEHGDARALADATAAIFTARRARGEGPWLTIRDDLPGTTNRERAELFVFGWAARDRVLGTAALVRSLLVRAQSILAETHARSGAIGFGAALRLARDALRDDPLAAARVSSGFDALLVDEFQDTSRVQVDLVRLLWERDPKKRAPGAMPVFGDVRPRGLLVVGDRKQSIYAFRGADVGVFMTTCVELAGEPARRALDLPEELPLPARTTADFFALRENRRSSDAIIEFVNAFSRVALRADGEDLSEARYSEELESLVAADSTPHAHDAVSWIRPPGEPRDTTRLEDATLVASFIANAIASPPEDVAPYAFRDFAVLAQSNEMLDAAAFALSRTGIPHVVAGRGFFAAREVQDLLALLRWIDRPDDRAALLAVLRGPCAALSDRTLLALTETHRGLVTDFDRWDALDRRGLVDEDDRPALERVRTTLRALRRSAEKLGPARALRVAVRALEIEQSLVLLPRGVQRVANVRKLMRVADEEPTIRALLDRAARAEERAREPEAATFSEDDDAVRLVTLHASKGLAFRVVLLPELRGSPIRSANTTLGLDLRSNPAWLATKVLGDRGEPIVTPSIKRLSTRDRARLRADRRRLMYVAVTRARERLVFVGGVKSTRTDPSFAAVLRDLPGAVSVSEMPLELPQRAASRDAITVGPIVAPHVPRTIELAIAPTALQDFHHCARRFELVHLVALPEPTPTALGGFRADGAPTTNARAEGDALHAVLERVDLGALGSDDSAYHARAALTAVDVGLSADAEGRVLAAATRFLQSDYARAAREAKAEIFRERAFVVEIATSAITLTLRGAMDFVARFPNGDIDVVDYKRARSGDTRPHALQLDVYAYVCARSLAVSGGARVRAGAVFLGGNAPSEPQFRPSVTPAKLEARLIELATSLLEARRARAFPRAGAKTCHAIGCGYFTLCHPRTEKRQLTLFR